MLPWQPILGGKSAKLPNIPSFVALTFLNRWQYCNWSTFTKLSGLVGIWVQIINLTFAWRPLKTRWYGKFLRQIQMLTCDINVCHLCSLYWRSTTNLNIAMPTCAFICGCDDSARLYIVQKFGELVPVTPAIMKLECVQQGSQWVCLNCVRWRHC